MFGAIQSSTYCTRLPRCERNIVRHSGCPPPRPTSARRAAACELGRAARCCRLCGLPRGLGQSGGAAHAAARANCRDLARDSTIKRRQERRIRSRSRRDSHAQDGRPVLATRDRPCAAQAPPSGAGRRVLREPMGRAAESSSIAKSAGRCLRGRLGAAPCPQNAQNAGGSTRSRGGRKARSPRAQSLTGHMLESRERRPRPARTAHHASQPVQIVAQSAAVLPTTVAESSRPEEPGMQLGRAQGATRGLEESAPPAENHRSLRLGRASSPSATSNAGAEVEYDRRGRADG